LSSVKVKATVVEDNTGIKSQLPVLLTEQGELSVVTDYLLKMEANKDLFNDPKILFQTDVV